MSGIAAVTRPTAAGIFSEHLGELVDIARHGQMGLRQVFEAHLRRIERDPNEGTVVRAVTIDPVVSFGRPVVAGTRIPAVELANRFSAGEPIESLALDLNLAKETIEEAIRYQLATRGRAA